MDWNAHPSRLIRESMKNGTFDAPINMKKHITNLISPGRVEHGVAELVLAMQDLGLQPERACAGHGKNASNFPELPYVHFRAPSQRLAYRLHLAAVMATTHGYSWSLRAGFSSYRGMNNQIINYQSPRQLRYFLELHPCTALYTKHWLLPSKLSELKITDAIAEMTNLVDEAINPQWYPSELKTLGFKK
jgi:hypothetical protein